MNVLEKILKEIEEMRDIMKSAVATDCFGKECESGDCTVCVCERAMEIIRSHMDEVTDTESVEEERILQQETSWEMNVEPADYGSEYVE